MSIFRRRYVRESCDVIINAKKSENDAELMRVLYSAAPTKCSNSTKLTKRDAAKFIPTDLKGFENNTVITNFDALEYFTSFNTLAYRYGFWGCTSLESIKLPKGITSLNTHSFSSCTSLKKLHLPDSVVILNSQWGSRSSFEVNMPPFIEEMGNNSFNCSTTKKVAVPKTLKSMGADTFRGAPIEECVFENGIGITEIPNTCFYTCYDLKYVYIPDGITKIGDVSFGNTKALLSLTLPNTVETIGKSAFSSSAIQVIGLGDNIKSIGSQAFQYSGKITSIYIGSKVETIAARTLNGVAGLTSLHIPASVTSLGEDFALDVGRNMEAITVSPKNTVYDSRENCNAIIETATNTLLLGCSYTKIPEGVEKLGKDCFFYQNNMRNIVFTFPSTFKEFSGTNFRYCGLYGSKMIFLNPEPPIGTSPDLSTCSAIYVPDESIDAYKQCEPLSNYAAKIKPMSEFV